VIAVLTQDDCPAFVVEGHSIRAVDVCLPHAWPTLYAVDVQARMLRIVAEQGDAVRDRSLGSFRRATLAKDSRTRRLTRLSWRPLGRIVSSSTHPLGETSKPEDPFRPQASTGLHRAAQKRR
jgi:hypothetical protein